jgi:2'-5' RNA ligase
LNQLPDEVRAFVALRIGVEAERALAEFIEEIRREGGDIRWTRAEKLHLTLRFLGAAVDCGLLPPLAEALAKIAAAGAPFAIEARGIGAFPDLNRPRVVWAGLESADLPALAAKIEEAAVRCGFASEKRPYSPHLTIGRVRGMRRWDRVRAALDSASKREFGRSIVEEIILYRSVLGAGSYQELGRFKFGQAIAARV